MSHCVAGVHAEHATEALACFFQQLRFRQQHPSRLPQQRPRSFACRSRGDTISVPHEVQDHHFAPPGVKDEPLVPASADDRFAEAVKFRGSRIIAAIAQLTDRTCSFEGS